MTDKKEWIIILSKLNNDFSQLLYLIFYLEKNKVINYEQKINLKNLLLNNPQSLIPFLKKLKITNNLFKFTESVTKLIPEEQIEEDKNSSNNVYLNKSKHLITISNDSLNDEITKDDNGF